MSTFRRRALLPTALLLLAACGSTPLAFSAVGRVAPSHVAAALVLVTTGFLAGPLLIGAFAHASSRWVALLLVLVLVLVTAVLAGQIQAQGVPARAGN